MNTKLVLIALACAITGMFPSLLRAESVHQGTLLVTGGIGEHEPIHTKYHVVIRAEADHQATAIVSLICPPNAMCLHLSTIYRGELHSQGSLRYFSGSGNDAKLSLAWRGVPRRSPQFIRNGDGFLMDLISESETFYAADIR